MADSKGGQPPGVAALGTIIALSPLAKKVPRPQRTGDHMVDAKRHIDYNCKVAIIDKMEKEPYIIQPLHGLMQSHDLKNMASVDVEKGSPWTGNYKHVQSLPRGWMSEYLLARARALGIEAFITKQVLADLEVFCSDAIPTLFFFDTQLAPGCAWPPVLNDKYVASRTVIKRSEEVGNRLAVAVRKGLLSTPKQFDFMKAGCYELLFGENRLQTITHISGALAEVPDHIVVTKQFKLEDNHLDHLARVTLPPAKFYLWEFFGAAPFVQYMCVKGKKFCRLKDLGAAEKEVQKADDLSKKQSEIQVNTEVMQKAQEERSNAAMKRARERLLEKAEERKRLRSGNLDMLPAPSAEAALQDKERGEAEGTN